MAENNTIKQDTNNTRSFHISGKSFVDGGWYSCGWDIQAKSFEEAAKIAEADPTFQVKLILSA